MPNAPENVTVLTAVASVSVTLIIDVSSAASSSSFIEAAIVKFSLNALVKFNV